MPYRFNKHYSIGEARALLPQVRGWLQQLLQKRTELEGQEEQLQVSRPAGGDLGGADVDGWVRTLAAMQELLLQFYRREIQIKDLDRGLIDFPAILEDREVFLCWELAEDDIEYWHDLDAGYAGRVPLEE